MNIEINENTYELNLGYRFSNALDKVYTVKQDIGGGQKVEFGVGINFIYSYLSMANFDAVIQFYKAGLTHVKPRPNDNAIIDAVEELAAEHGIKQVADWCIEGLRDSGFYKQILTQIEAEDQATKK